MSHVTSISCPETCCIGQAFRVNGICDIQVHIYLEPNAPSAPVCFELLASESDGVMGNPGSV